MWKTTICTNIFPVTLTIPGNCRGIHSTKSKQLLPARGRGVDGPAEVGDLEVALHVEEEVLRLDITVDHLKHSNQQLLRIIYKLPNIIYMTIGEVKLASTLMLNKYRIQKYFWLDICCALANELFI